MAAELTATLRIVLMCGAIGAIGWPLFLGTAHDPSGRAALSWTTGLAALTILLALASRAGMPIGSVTVVIAAVTLIALGRLVGRRDAVGVSETPPAAGTSFSAILPMSVFALDVWKIFTVPVWSWDHYAIWGAKARLLSATGMISSLGSGGHPQYPPGFPVALHSLNGGVMVDHHAVRLIHVVFLGSVLLLVRALVLGKSGRIFVADLSAAVAALLPLAWDTEAVGLAEAAVAAFACATAVLAFSSERSWIALGLCAGALPWMKLDAVPLAFLLLVLSLGRGRRRMPMLALAAITALASLLVSGGGPSFLDGDWRFRFAYRFARPEEVLLPIWGYLKVPAALGVWMATPVALLIALGRRRGDVAALLAIVIAQVAVYCAVYFATNLDSTAHIESSFHRIIAALAPLAVSGIALALTEIEGLSRPDHP